MKKHSLILAILMIGGLSLIAQPGKQEGRPDRGERPEDRLQLTEAQQLKMDELKVTFNKTSQPMKNQLDEKRAVLKSLTSVDSPDKKKIEATVNEIGKLETSMLQARVNHELELRSILDDKQKMMFDQRHDKMASHGKGNMHPRN